MVVGVQRVFCWVGMIVPSWRKRAVVAIPPADGFSSVEKNAQKVEERITHVVLWRSEAGGLWED